MNFKFWALALAGAMMLSMASQSYAQEMAREIIMPMFTAQHGDQVQVYSKMNHDFTAKKGRVADGMNEIMQM